MSAEDHLEEQAAELKAAGCLRKPVEPDDLLRAVWQYATADGTED